MSKSSCFCMNEGRCIYELGITRCECPRGFVGERCGEADIDMFFEETRKEKESSFNYGIPILFMVTLLLLLLGIVGFFCWRRMRSIKRNRKRKLSFVDDKPTLINQSTDSRLDECLLVHLNQASLISCDDDSLNDDSNSHHATKLHFELKLQSEEKSTALNRTKNAPFSSNDIELPLDLQLPLNLQLPRRKRRKGVSR